MLNRLQQFADYKGTTLTAMERELEFGNGVLTKALKNKHSISCSRAEKILLKYRELSAEWLFLGVGEMIKNKEDKELKILHTSKLEDIKKEEQAIKLYPLEASANLNTIFCDDSTDTDYIYIPNAPKCDAAIYVRGDSMTPVINSGDIVAYKNISSLEYLQFGQMYLVHFELDGDYFLVIKYVRKSDKQGYVRLESHNTFHQPQEIPLSAIRNIALIKLSIRQNTQF